MHPDDVKTASGWQDLPGSTGLRSETAVTPDQYLFFDYCLFFLLYAQNHSYFCNT